MMNPGPQQAQGEEDLSWEGLGARLREARETAGFRQEDVAELLGISRPTVVAIEAGKTRIHSLLLRRLATLYRRELDSFFGEPPSVPDLERMVFERLDQLSPKDRETITRFLTFCHNLSFVRRLLGRDPPDLPPRRTITPHARKYAAEVAAKEERARLGLGDAPIGDHFFDLLDTLGLPVYRAPLEDQGIAGLLISHPLAGPVIFINEAQYRWRKVFSAVHEYGHFLFHQTVQPVLCRIFDPAHEPAEVTDEQFVNAFASEFLMPEDGIKRLLVTVGAASGRLGPHDVVALQRHFGVSFQAMLYRLLHLRLLREADFQQMKSDVRPVALAWHMGYAFESEEFSEGSGDDIDLTRTFPTSYVEMVLEAFEKRAVSNGRAAEMLSLNRGAFDQFYRYWRRQAEAWPSEEQLEHIVV